ncbi:MAG TPA: tetratricopeptide repeat protein [Bacteroidales bacterium]|nr:tetratricopeptide repeat protein [Bacteroidales bacterium]
MDKKKRPTKKTTGSVSPAISRKQEKQAVYLLSAALIVAVFITFFPVVHHEFVNWDDDQNVYENHQIDNLSAENIRAIFTTPVLGNYNPLPILTFAIEKQFFGLDPGMYHLDNLLLHILNTLLVFFLARGLGLRLPGAFLLAMLFGIQPMRVESVAWVTERKDVLYGFFTLAALLCYTRWLDKGKRKWIVWTYLLFMISVFAKIQAVALPLSLLAIDYFKGRRLRWKPWIEKIPMFLISLVVGILGIYLLSAQKSLDQGHYSLMEKLLIGSYSLVIYIVKSIVPYEMSAIYPFPKPGYIPWFFYLTPFILASILAVVLYSLKRTKVVAFGTLFFLFNIMFLLQIVSAGQGFIADRFGYIAYFGLFFIYAWGFQWLLENRKKWSVLVWVTATVVVIILAGVCRNRVYAWKNPETLWTDVLSKYRNVPVAYNNRGKYYREQGQPEKALADYNEMLRINPDDFNGFNSRGRLYFDRGDIDKAMPDFNRSIALNPRFAKAYSNRGAVYGLKNDYVHAVADFTKALELNPREYVTYSNRALAYLSMGKYTEAAADCESYLNVFPDDAEIIDMEAVCFLNLKQYEKALTLSDKAIELDPSKGAFFLNRSYIRYFLGDKVAALADAEKATQAGIKVNEGYLEGLKKK